MIAVDTNILVYAHREDSIWHSKADQAVADLAEGTSYWAVPWPCFHEFVAIVTHPRIYKPPTPIHDALIQVKNWMESPGLVPLSEGGGFFGIWDEVLRKSAVTGGSVHDARVAVLCIYHGVKKLLSADRDFSRFPQLRTENPLLK